MRAAKVQARLRIRAVSPEPSLLAHISSESRGTFSQKARSLAPLNGWACAVKICHDGMLEDTNSLDGAQTIIWDDLLGGIKFCFNCCFALYRTVILETGTPIRLFERQLSRIMTKTDNMACAPSEDSDQLGHPPSLIRALLCALLEAKDPCVLQEGSTGWWTQRVIHLVLSRSGSNYTEILP